MCFIHKNYTIFIKIINIWYSRYTFPTCQHYVTYYFSTNNVIQLITAQGYWLGIRRKSLFLFQTICPTCVGFLTISTNSQRLAPKLSGSYRFPPNFYTCGFRLFPLISELTRLGPSPMSHRVGSVSQKLQWFVIFVILQAIPRWLLKWIALVSHRTSTNDRVWHELYTKWDF